MICFHLFFFILIKENHETDTQKISEQERKKYEIPSVDNALTNLLSLPQVVKDVSHIHKGHTLEIRKQQQILETVQVMTLFVTCQ